MLATIQEHSFLDKGLGPHATVIDLGANRGEFSREVAERYGARCLAVEANGELVEGISDRPGVSAYHLAIGGRNGVSDFRISPDSERSGLADVVGGSGIRTEQVREVTFDTFLAERQLTMVELVKVDIEGAEKALFETAPDEALLRVAQFTVEFHDFAGLLSRADVGRIERRLRDLGFYGVKVTRTNYNWLFFQPERCDMGRLQAAATRYLERNVVTRRETRGDSSQAARCS